MTTRIWTITLVGLAALLLVAAVLAQELRQQAGASSNIFAGLIVEEYPIVAADVDSPGHFEFLDRIPDDVLARREVWRGLDAEQRVSTLNEILAPSTWEGHWILEAVEGVFTDGESLTEQLGVGDIFHYVIFQGQPLFFFKRGRQVNISYGGETLPVSYDRVSHYWCCYGSAFNVESSEHMLWFYSLKDGIWHYVEIGIYDE